MNKKIISLLMVFSLALVLSVPEAQAQRGKNTSAMPSGPRRHLSTIVFAGVAGAILGLSTLSFYGRPQDKLSHIAIGAAIGIISGTMYTTFKAATEPKDFYSLRERGPNAELWAMSGAAQRFGEGHTPRAALTFEF